MVDDNIIQIYAQSFWHTPAYIMGTRVGLQALNDAITHLLSVGRTDSKSVDTFDIQGEGYSIVIRECTEAELKSLASQYTDEAAQHPGRWPAELCREEP